MCLNSIRKPNIMKPYLSFTRSKMAKCQNNYKKPVDFLNMRTILLFRKTNVPAININHPPFAKQCNEAQSTSYHFSVTNLPQLKLLSASPFEQTIEISFDYWLFFWMKKVMLFMNMGEHLPQATAQRCDSMSLYTGREGSWSNLLRFGDRHYLCFFQMISTQPKTQGTGKNVI